MLVYISPRYLALVRRAVVAHSRRAFGPSNAQTAVLEALKTYVTQDEATHAAEQRERDARVRVGPGGVAYWEEALDVMRDAT